MGNEQAPAPPGPPAAEEDWGLSEETDCYARNLTSDDLELLQAQPRDRGYGDDW
jgi:hypothetical protein